MEVHKVYWWQHKTKIGQYSTAKVHRLLDVTVKPGVDLPNSIADYDIQVASLPDLALEEINGE